MKTKYSLIAAFLLLASGLLASCNTENTNSNNIYGTWKVDGPQHATWIGGANGAGHIAASVAEPVEVTRIYTSQADSTDSTVVDSTVTMTYPNADFSAVMTTEAEFPNQANISIKITDHQIPPEKSMSIQLDSTQASLGDNFIHYYGFSSSFHVNTGGYSISPTYKFDCSQPIQPVSGNLRYIVKIKPTDSTWEVFKYNLRLKGIQQAAERVACH